MLLPAAGRASPPPARGRLVLLPSEPAAVDLDLSDRRRLLVQPAAPALGDGRGPLRPAGLPARLLLDPAPGGRAGHGSGHSRLGAALRGGPCRPVAPASGGTCLDSGLLLRHPRGLGRYLSRSSRDPHPRRSRSLSRPPRVVLHRGPLDAPRADGAGTDRASPADA